MTRRGYRDGGNVTVRVVFAGTVTFCRTVMARPWPGGVIVAATMPVCGAGVWLVMSVRTVRPDRVRPAVLCSSTCALPSDSAPSTASWTGNWMPVLLSGGICVQSTLSTVNIDVGSFGLTSIASEFVPDTTTLEMLKVKRVYAPVTVADVATSVPFTQTLADPITPLTISVAVCPDVRFGVKSVRHHQGTLNRLVVTEPILLMNP